MAAPAVGYQVCEAMADQRPIQQVPRIEFLLVLESILAHDSLARCFLLAGRVLFAPRAAVASNFTQLGNVLRRVDLFVAKLHRIGQYARGSEPFQDLSDPLE